MRCFVLVCVLALCCQCRGQDDVVGCGGFVRSKYLDNFSRIKVRETIDIIDPLRVYSIYGETKYERGSI